VQETHAKREVESQQLENPDAQQENSPSTATPLSQVPLTFLQLQSLFFVNVFDSKELQIDFLHGELLQHLICRCIAKQASLSS
jgi:hypothetical protein